MGTKVERVIPYDPPDARINTQPVSTVSRGLSKPPLLTAS
jgi:hypothetical protein